MFIDMRTVHASFQSNYIVSMLVSDCHIILRCWISDESLAVELARTGRSRFRRRDSFIIIVESVASGEKGGKCKKFYLIYLQTSHQVLNAHDYMTRCHCNQA